MAYYYIYERRMHREGKISYLCNPKMTIILYP